MAPRACRFCRSQRSRSPPSSATAGASAGRNSGAATKTATTTITRSPSRKTASVTGIMARARDPGARARAARAARDRPRLAARAGARAPPEHHPEGERGGGHGRKRRHPGEPVEAPERRRREHLFAVAGAEGGEDRLLALAAGEPLGDLALHGLARRALEMVAGVNGEPAPALAGERLLDLLLRRRGSNERPRREQRRERERPGVHADAHRAGAPTRPAAHARSRRSSGLGHIAIAVPSARIAPPIQIHDTSGFT